MEEVLGRENSKCRGAQMEAREPVQGTTKKAKWLW